MIDNLIDRMYDYVTIAGTGGRFSVPLTGYTAGDTKPAPLCLKWG